ncbi:hypothetical protein HDU76_012346 [Blyttiomyces sp. JEL0837]|nr:hypothetical protein HDU76_012346 [Blyttiomyces sp. JEL0837]
MGEVAVKNPSRLFKVGAPIKCRVLGVDIAARKLTATLKKPLVNSTLPIISSYENTEVGTVTEGHIMAVKSFGCIVGFYNNVKAVVPIGELSERFVSNPEELFVIGQCVKCKVISVDAANEKMTVSFKRVFETPVNGGSGSGSGSSNIEIGEVVEGRILSIMPESVLLELLPSLARGTLTKSHMSDHLGHVDAMFKSLKEGEMLNGLVVIGKDEKKGRILVSRKQQLVRFEKDTEIGVGSVVPGYVRSCTDSKVFVGLPGGRLGIAKIHNVSDSYVAKIDEVVKPGQTVVALVTSVNEENNSFELSLKSSQLAKTAASQADTLFLSTYFMDEDYLQAKTSAATPGSALSLKDWNGKLALGKVVSGTIKQRTPYGFLVDVEGGIASGIITMEPGKSGSELKQGEQVKVRIVDADFARRIVDLKVVSEDIKGSDEAHAKAVKAAFDKKDPVDAIIELVKANYLVLSLPSQGHRLVYVPTRGYNNSGASGSMIPKNYRSGQKVRVNLTQIESATGKKQKFDGFLPQRNLGVLASTPGEAESKQDTKSKRENAIKEGKRVVKDPVDPSVTCLEDLTFGTLIKGKILSVKPVQLNITLGSNLKGRVVASELTRNFGDIEDPNKPFKAFKAHSTHTFKVVGFHEEGNSHKFLPISHRNPTSKTVVELTLCKEDLALPNGELALAPELRHPTLSGIAVGSVHLAFVQRVSADSIWASLGPGLMGRVIGVECSNDAAVANDIAGNFPIGKAIRVMVLSKDESKTELNLSIRAVSAAGKANTGMYPLSISRLKANGGASVLGKVTKVSKEIGLIVQVADKLSGRVSLAEISDEMPEEPTEGIKVGDFVSCRLIYGDEAANRLDLSLKALPPKPAKGKAAEKYFKDEQIIKGYVKNVSDGGVYVDVGHGFVGRVRVKDVSDEYVKDWKPLVKVGGRVVAKVLSVDEFSRRLELSLKRSAIDPTYKPPAKGGKRDDDSISFSDLKKGMKVDGHIKAVGEVGVFVQIEGSKLSGLCHKTELSDKPISDHESLFTVGDPVKAYILKVDPVKKRISFSLKASHFTQEDLENGDDDEEDDDDEDGDEEEGDAMDEDVDNDEEVDEDDMDGDGDMEVDEDDGEGGDDDDVDGDEEEEDEIALDSMAMDVGSSGADRSAPATIMDVQPLDLGGFGWGDEDEAQELEFEEGGNDDEDDDDAEAGDKSQSKRSRRAKKRARREEEERIAEKERELLDAQAPDTAEAFERLLMGSPNSSFLWIKFMAFHLQMAEIGKAREVAEKALKTISFREEQELMNVYVAMLNLENSYGDREKVMKVFEKATQRMPPKAIYLHMAQIYERTGKIEDLETLFKGMVKRFKESCKVWVAYGLSALKRGKVDESRSILQRSLKSLPRRKHVKVVSKFAQMEFKYGEPERGRTLYEGILANHPKRLDMWSVYLDMEIRNGDLDRIRRLFERSITVKFSSKKMKFLFKKYLEFERSKGTAEGMEHVKQAAMAYVESISQE